MFMAESLGKRIARLSSEKGIGLKQLAIASGLSEGAISKLKSMPERSTSFEAGLQIAKVLGVDPWELAQVLPPVPGELAGGTGSRLPEELLAWMRTTEAAIAQNLRVATEAKVAAEEAIQRADSAMRASRKRSRSA